jgi:hypothetical protein
MIVYVLLASIVGVTNVDTGQWQESRSLNARREHRSIGRTDKYEFVVSTGALFRDLPDPGKARAVDGMSLSDLKSASK